MTITAVFANEENTQISWTNEQGQVWSVPYPLADGEIPRQIQSWIDEGNAIAPYAPPAPTVIDVQQERARRLALGFAYDFGDQRGVHHIGTTPADMEGWRDVIYYANALIDSGDTETQIGIVTDTGTTAVTAPEWQVIMLEAASVRQIIWAASFALQAMQPIPGDYADDSYWS